MNPKRARAKNVEAEGNPEGRIRGRRPAREPKKDVAFDPVSDLQVTTANLRIMRINMKREGIWHAAGLVVAVSPARNPENDNSVKINEKHDVRVSAKVTSAEVAAVAGITEEEVRTTLTLAQIDEHVGNVAVAKICAAMGLTPPT